MQDTRTLSSDNFRTGLAVLLILAVCGLIAAVVLAVPPLIVAALAMMAVFAAVILANPYWGLIILIGIIYVRPETFLGKIGDIKTFTFFSYSTTILTVFAYLLQLLLKRATFRWRPELFWMGAFGLAIIVSTFQLPGYHDALQAVIGAGRLAVVFFLLTQLLHTERRIHTTVQWLLFFVTILAVEGIHGWVTGTNVYMEHGVPRARGTGPYIEPNHLASALVMPVPIAVLRILRGGTWFSRLWGGIALGVLLTAIYLTNSRGGMLALAVALAVFLVRYLGWAKGLTIGAVVLGLMLAFGPDRFATQEVSRVAVVEDDSAMGRIDAWRAGLSMFERNPLFGVGYDQFTQYHRIPGHNSFVHVLGECGFLGAATWVGLNYWCILTLIRLRRAKKDQPAGENTVGYGIAMLAALLAALQSGTVANRCYSFDPLFVMAIGSSLGAFLPQTRRVAWSELVHVMAVIGITLGYISWVYVMVRFFN